MMLTIKWLPGLDFSGDRVSKRKINGYESTTRDASWKADPDDRWYYFSNMPVDELLVFKGNDTWLGDTQSVLHTGFDNTAAEPNAIPRESLEARFFVFWK